MIGAESFSGKTVWLNGILNLGGVTIQVSAFSQPQCLGTQEIVWPTAVPKRTVDCWLREAFNTGLLGKWAHSNISLKPVLWQHLVKQAWG